ncbi:hemC, partial [Symbiodinium pilosum]
MDDGQLSPLSASDHETSSSFRQLTSDSFGASSPIGDTPRHKVEKATRQGANEPRSGGGLTAVLKEEEDCLLKVPGHVHFDETVYLTPKASKNKPLKLIGHHLEPKPDPGQTAGENGEDAAESGESKVLQPPPPPPKSAKSSKRPHRVVKYPKHPPRLPTAKPQQRDELDMRMEVCGSPLRSAPEVEDGAPGLWQAELRSDIGAEEHVEDVSSERPAMPPKPRRRPPGGVVHSVSKEAMTGEEEEKTEVIESASSFVELVPCFPGDKSASPRPPANAQPKKADTQGPKQRRPRRKKPMLVKRSHTIERTEGGEALPREFAKISHMIATTRAKQQLPQKDASEPDQEEAVETASVEIQCESFSGDSPGPLGSSRTFMLFRCEPGSVTLQNWRRLEYPRPPMSKLELYLHCFADRFPGALDSESLANK